MYSVFATGVIAIPPSGPETVHSVKVFNLVLQINKQTDDSTLLDIQTRLSDKKKREIGVTWNICRGTFCSSKSLSNSACKSVSAKRKSTSVVLYY
jgi:hypothetical protein